MLPVNTDTYIGLYADDISIYVTANNMTNLNNKVETLVNMIRWFDSTK